MRILHLEDDIYIHKAVSCILERSGHEVFLVMDSSAAIEELNSGRFDFFLSDWEVVGGTSYPALKEAAKLDIPLLVHSGSIQEVRDSGIDCLMLDKCSLDLRKLAEAVNLASSTVVEGLTA